MRYPELARVGKQYHKDTNFCGVIAVAVATGIKFTKASSLLRKGGRTKRKGTPFHAFNYALEKLGYYSESYEGKQPKSLATAVRMLPKKGTFWILTNRHITCIKDGVMDDWTAERNSRKRVIWIKEIKKY